MKSVLASLVLFALVAATHQAAAQGGQESVVTIYNVAAGKHLDFLKWMAENEAVAKEAGAPTAQWYVHHNGAGWDYISIAPRLGASEQEVMDKKSSYKCCGDITRCLKDSVSGCRSAKHMNE